MSQESSNLGIRHSQYSPQFKLLSGSIYRVGRFLNGDLCWCGSILQIHQHRNVSRISRSENGIRYRWEDRKEFQLYFAISSLCGCIFMSLYVCFMIMCVYTPFLLSFFSNILPSRLLFFSFSEKSTRKEERERQSLAIVHIDENLQFQKIYGFNFRDVFKGAKKLSTTIGSRI